MWDVGMSTDFAIPIPFPTMVSSRASECVLLRWRGLRWGGLRWGCVMRQRKGKLQTDQRRWQQANDQSPAIHQLPLLPSAFASALDASAQPGRVSTAFQDAVGCIAGCTGLSCQVDSVKSGPQASVPSELRVSKAWHPTRHTSGGQWKHGLAVQVWA